MRRLLLFIPWVALVSCGGGSSSPAAPSQPPAPAQISGNWVGTFSYTPIGGGGAVVTAVTASFTQASNNVTGQINITGGARVTLSGVVDSTTLTASTQYTGATGACVGTASVSGTVSSAQVRFTIPSIATSGQCTFFTNGEFVLTK